MKKLYVSITILILIFGFLSVNCDKSTNNDPDSSSIYGKVLGPSGEPVENALVELNYIIEWIDTTVGFKEGMLINSIDQRMNLLDYYTLLITRYNRPEDTVKVMTFDTTHSIFWNGTNMENQLVVSGVYDYSLIKDSILSSGSLVLLRDYDTLDCANDELEYYAISDEKGEFAISQEYLPFGFEGMGTDSVGYYIGQFIITRYIKCWALHHSFRNTRVDSVYVDSIMGVDLILQFE